MSGIPFQKIEWASLLKTEYKGEFGSAFWKTIQLKGLRIRMVEYSPGYLADHWCRKGHIVHCLEGGFESQMESGDSIQMNKGDTYVVSDELSSHRSYSENGALLLIVDGDFLKLPGS